MKLVCIGSSSKGNGYALIGKNEILLLEAGCRLLEVKKGFNQMQTHGMEFVLLGLALPTR